VPDVESPVKVLPDGTPLIYPFEKHYIKLLFEAEIERVGADGAKLMKSRFKQNRSIAEMVEHTYLRDIKTTLDRFMSMGEVPR